MTRRTLLAALGTPVLHGFAARQARYIDGVFVHNGQAPIELLAYAERAGSGRLHLAAASFEDVPVVDRVHRVLCSLPTFKPALVWASTRAIFRDDYASRRQLPFGGRQVNVYAVELRIADVETPERTARLIKALRPTDEDPALLFFTVSSSSFIREYLVQLKLSDGR